MRYTKKKTFYKRPLINNFIRAREVRVIDKDGKNLGVLKLSDALRISREQDLDLIQITEKLETPVCKIMNYGKYQYFEKKQQKKSDQKKQQGGEMKGIRLGFNISPHDMETRAKQAEKFLKQGDRVRIDLILRGRQKALQGFAREKINKFLEILEKTIPYKIERELKKVPRGLTIIIAQDPKGVIDDNHENKKSDN
ncbi:translation initiation factor IF-3 [Candidatus Parcubacteria bacterium]|nr:translation initiation factor IF-3 [Candidatus Parcubacteria bacterium]